jgi:hypothetical protein
MAGLVSAQLVQRQAQGAAFGQCFHQGGLKVLAFVLLMVLTR